MKKLLWLVGLVMVTLAQTADAAVAGRFQFVSGEVKVISAEGKERIAHKGDEVSQGDTITSSSSASAQVKMADDGLIIVRPDTKLRITIFQYNGKTDGSERSLISLVQGGFRAITGMIGHFNQENYKIETPTATIGIRGTDHEPMFIPNPVAGKVALAEPGTYDKVNSGAAVLSTSKGLVVINPNQAGFVPNVANAAPTVLANIPAFYKVAPTKDEPKIVPGARLQPGGEQRPAQAGSTTGSADGTARVAPAGTATLTTKSGAATGTLTTKTGAATNIAPTTTVSPTTKTLIAPTTLTTTIKPVTTTTIAPTTTIQPITTTTIAPTTLTTTIQPITTTTIAPTTTIQPITTTTIAPTTLTTTIQPITTTTIAPTMTIQPITTTTIAPTTLTTTIQPITTTIAPTTTIQPITTTTIAPITTIQPITTTTTIAPTTTTIQPITTTIQPTTTFSDRRLKKNIKRVGTHRLGIGIYEFDYIRGGHAIGVMADEVRLVRPDAVLRDASGYDMVDYSKLD